MSEITMPSFPAGTRREETAQGRAEMVEDFDEALDVAATAMRLVMGEVQG